MNDQFAWCPNCKVLSPVFLQHCEAADTGRSQYTDVVCKACAYIVATVTGHVKLVVMESDVKA